MASWAATSGGGGDLGGGGGGDLVAWEAAVGAWAEPWALPKSFPRRGSESGSDARGRSGDESIQQLAWLSGTH
jgi:hypothetical protein